MTNADRWMLPEGVDELLPEQAALAERVRRDILDLFRQWGYQLVSPPLIEFSDSLLIGMGHDVELQSFRVTDQISGKPLAIRADITPQAARIDAHSMSATGVNRLCYAGSVLHTRAKTLMASRCPMQIGAEIYGEASAMADVEVISLMLDTLVRVGVENLTLDLGHVDIYSEVAASLQEKNPSLQPEALEKIFDAVQRKSLPDLQRLAPSVVADEASLQLLYALPGYCGDSAALARARTELSILGPQVVAAIEQLQSVAEFVERRFPQVNIYFDLAELRGFGYHTGIVFAAYAEGYGHALANGGRYDHIGEVFGAARPATGFNTDIKALLAIANVSEDAAAKNDFIAAPTDNCAELWETICQLREAGEVVVYFSAVMPEQCNRVLRKEGSDWKLVPRE